MSLARFLEVLFQRGEVVFRRKPAPAPQRDPEALRVLEREYKRYALDLPGEVPTLEPELALKAAEVLRFASWYMLSRDEPDEEVTARVALQGTSSTPMQHFSTDLTLRFAARIHRRAKALNPGDSLVRGLENTLRRRPLSGVLCDLEDPPISPSAGRLRLPEHPGLMLLYAERLADHPKPEWLPEGKALEYVELVKERRGAPV